MMFANDILSREMDELMQYVTDDFSPSWDDADFSLDSEEFSSGFSSISGASSQGNKHALFTLRAAHLLYCIVPFRSQATRAQGIRQLKIHPKNAS
jgi:hypothetical protein